MSSVLTGIYEEDVDKEKDGVNMSLAILVGALREPEETARDVKKQTPAVKRMAYIGGNVRGNAEIYFEMENDIEAQRLAMLFQMIPAPVAGKILYITFEELINSSNFKMMGGKIVD